MGTTEDLHQRVWVEYLEMPGLTLTPKQVQRLCGIERAVCQTILDTLVENKLLRVTPDGQYARLAEQIFLARARRRPTSEASSPSGKLPSGAITHTMFRDRVPTCRSCSRSPRPPHVRCIACRSRSTSGPILRHVDSCLPARREDADATAAGPDRPVHGPLDALRPADGPVRISRRHRMLYLIALGATARIGRLRRLRNRACGQ
jgi:hypothetical protein